MRRGSPDPPPEHEPFRSHSCSAGGKGGLGSPRPHGTLNARGPSRRVPPVLRIGQVWCSDAAPTPPWAGRASPRMKKLSDYIWPVIGLAAVVFSGWLLFKELRGLSLAE